MPIPGKLCGMQSGCRRDASPLARRRGQDTRNLRCDALETDITALLSWADDMPRRTPNASAFKARIRASVDRAVEAVALARLSRHDAATFQAHLKEAAKHLAIGEDERTHAQMLNEDASKKQSLAAAHAPRRKNPTRERVLARMRRARKKGTPFKEYMRDWLSATGDQLTVAESKSDANRYVVRDHEDPRKPALLHGELGHDSWSHTTLLSLYSLAVRAAKKQ